MQSEYQVCVFISKMIHSVNTHNRCVLVSRHSAKHAEGMLTTGLLRTELALEEYQLYSDG